MHYNFLTSHSGVVSQSVFRGISKRSFAEWRFKFLSSLCAFFALFIFLLFFIGIFYQSLDVFSISTLRIHVIPEDLSSDGTENPSVDLKNLSIHDARSLLPRVWTREFGVSSDNHRITGALLSILTVDYPFILRDELSRFSQLPKEGVDVFLPVSEKLHFYYKKWSEQSEESKRNLVGMDALFYVDQFISKGLISSHADFSFFKNVDSAIPYKAGLLTALVSSLWIMGVVLLVSLPLGVLVGVYLSEFAKRGILTDFLSVNIANLAAVPSIIFGLFGLMILIGNLGLPRSSVLVGGLVLSVMALPVIAIGVQVALASVPRSIRLSAFALGADKVQTVFGLVLPFAFPQIITAILMGLAKVLGETAPLIIVGMAAFITGIPQSLTDSGIALPVQIYLWSAAFGEMFQKKAAATILVLLLILFICAGIAALIRRRSSLW